MSTQYQVPATPRVISPSPTPSETSGKEGYFPPVTRSQRNSVGRAGSLTAVETIEEKDDPAQDEDPELSRARSRSRSPHLVRRESAKQMNGSFTTSARAGITPLTPLRKRTEAAPKGGKAKGFLSPESAYPRGFGSAYWRNLSRSPSPLGLIPIHREWRVFVHKHEIPRKLLHVSIGFGTLVLYYQGLQVEQIHPVLLALLIPIFTIDIIRFRWEAVNRLYIKLLGSFMRESEAHDRFNGVISYLAGLWFTMRFCPKDVAVMSVLLLSWCDTAASTFGRLWGKYTPRIRKGKSLAGSLAACMVGVLSAILFYGIIAPATGGVYDTGPDSFAFQGSLTLPLRLREQLGVGKANATVSGWIALALMSVVSGLVVSVSEAVDLFHLDDNLTIPVLCGIGLGVFLRVFGAG